MDVVGLGVQKLEPSVMEEERGEQSDKGSDRTKKLVFRHYCGSKMIGVLNERLTIEQKGYIEKSVFGWLLYLPSSIKIGRNLLSKLCGEWVDIMSGFYFGGKVIKFTEFDDLRKLVEAKNEHKNEEFVEEPLWGSEDGCQSTPVQHDQQTPVVERGFQMQQNTMYDRMKAQPRIRVKSVVKRSPYTAEVLIRTPKPLLTA
ncbi:uncharacterized protein HKW66_Vig0108000 [Vigna angularis]|uniref:Uncharacterized protein n=1 Tax=Phaseolus angularis TaxID=3914 RepID=A0A8T0KUD6_PHAAN|nr:uncharacterized protein HKW66_Vig0108000 [Vigna angularis]